MRKIRFIPLYLIAGFVLVIALVAIPYYFAYKDKIIPGVHFKKIYLGNQLPQQAIAPVEKYLGMYGDDPITLSIDGRKIKVSQEEFGFTLDSKGTVLSAYEVGRRGTLLEKLYEHYRAWRFGVGIKPAYEIDKEKFSQTISELAKNFETPPIEAKFEWQENDLVILPSSSGERVDKDKLSSLIINDFENLDFEPINVPISVVEPKIRKQNLEAIKEDVLNIVSNPPKLSYDSKTWEPSPKQVLSFLKFERPETKGSVGERNSLRPKLKQNEETLKNYLINLASQIDVEPKPGVFNLDGDRVTAFELPEDGKSLNISEAITVYSASLLSIRSVDAVELPVEITKAKGGANKYGIRELLGEGTTNFKGSSKGRIHNIGLAASRLRGILVPPGDVFSFNNSVGDISAETGYDQAYIIKDRRTILGTGGGVCQVSTTLFRSAFSAGLPMVERYPHSYRVYYYEPPMGFDATVYAPYTDLKFKNDTPNYILIYSYFDPTKYTLTFKIFGTNDGREVTIAGPIVHSQTPAPEPLYQEDSSLAPGEVKQIDFASPGAKVTVTRLVTRDGETLIDEKLHSNYTPWQAVYLVGPEEED